MESYLHILLFQIIFGVILIYFTIIFFSLKKEGFLSFTDKNLTHGEYPLAVDKPLLYGDYDVIDNPQVSSFNSSDIYKDYPIFPSASSESNNIRYWNKPTNGTCLRSEMCGGMYKNYTHRKTQDVINVPGWNKRVNYYKEKNCK